MSCADQGVPPIASGGIASTAGAEGPLPSPRCQMLGTPLCTSLLLQCSHLAAHCDEQHCSVSLSIHVRVYDTQRLTKAILSSQASLVLNLFLVLAWLSGE